MSDDITASPGAVNGTSQKFLLQAKVHGDRRLSEADLRVAYFIIDWYGIEGRNYTFTRHDRLAKYTGLDVRTVRRCIAKLVALGYIIIKMRGRWGRASEYLPVFLPIYGDKAQSSCSPHMRTSQSAHEDKAMSAHEDKAMSTQTLPPRSANEGVVVSPADAGLAPDGARPRGVGAASDGAAPFEAFWAVYPRKEGRAAARKAFDAATARGVSVETLIDGARRYAAAKAHADPNWLKFPATWLRDECWLEDPQPPRRKEPKPERAPKAKPEPVKPDDDDDDDEYETPEETFPIGSCVYHFDDGRKGEVVSVRGGEVMVRWETNSWSSMTWTNRLVFEDPLTPAARAAVEAKAAAEAEARAKRDAEAKAAAESESVKREEEARAVAERQKAWRAESERKRDEMRERFPIGARIDYAWSYVNDNGERVTKTEHGEVISVGFGGVEIRCKGIRQTVDTWQIDRGCLVVTDVRNWWERYAEEVTAS